MTPLVTIRCLVYNHEALLRQCLDGFVMQQTDFPFVAIVHDDASTDGSADIIREYAERYPDIIKPIYETENQYSKHKGNINRILTAATDPQSKYIATCEGDDCWTDPNKLQLQVSFLEQHPEYFMSTHAYTRHNLATGEREPAGYFDGDDLPSFAGRRYRTFTHADYFADRWFCVTLTLVHRNRDVPDEATRALYGHRTYDYVVRYYQIKQGPCAHFLTDMGTYHQHSGGVYSNRDPERWRDTYLNNLYILYRHEHEPAALRHLNRVFAQQAWHFISHGKLRRALALTRRHTGNVPAASMLAYAAYKIRKTLTAHEE